MLDLAGVFQAADLQHEQLRLGDFADHPRKLVLHELMRRDGLVAPLLAQQRVLQCAVVARHRGAERSPGDAIAGLIQAHQRRLQAAAFRQQIRFWDVHILQGET